MQKIKINDLKLDHIKRFKEDFALLTARKGASFNTMTISWGMLGHLWNQEVVEVYVRPVRHTFAFMEEDDFFTVSFFKAEYKEDLLLLGRISGKYEDKIQKTKLTPIQIENGVTFKEACFVIVANKIYEDFFNAEKFIDKNLLDNYPLKDYHKRYIGRIMALYEK